MGVILAEIKTYRFILISIKIIDKLRIYIYIYITSNIYVASFMGSSVLIVLYRTSVEEWIPGAFLASYSFKVFPDMIF